MKTLDREQIVGAVETAGLCEDDIREDYSGRGMYGDKCFGIVCGEREFALFCASAGSFMDDWDFVGDVRTDQMGLQGIYYFPGYQLGE